MKSHRQAHTLNHPAEESQPGASSGGVTPVGSGNGRPELAKQVPQDAHHGDHPSAHGGHEDQQPRENQKLLDDRVIEEFLVATGRLTVLLGELILDVTSNGIGLLTIAETEAELARLQQSNKAISTTTRLLGDLKKLQNFRSKALKTTLDPRWIDQDG